MSILRNGEQLGKAKIISNAVISSGASVPGRKLKSISYITLHNTGLVDVKANNFHRSLARENKLPNGRQASWHFSVDDIEIYQEVDTAYETWHAGNSTGNKNSISIEMTMWSNKEKQRLTYDNAARLVAKLMKMHNIPLSKVVQHNHWSGKNCPEYLRAGKHGYDWKWFISLVKGYYEEKPVASEKPTFTPYIVKVTADVLNVRSGPGTNYKITTKAKKGQAYTIVDESNGWGKLKSGLGWISLEYTDKKATSATAPTSKTPYTVIINTDVLNVRSGPGINYSVSTKVREGDKYTIVEEKDGWGKLKSGAGWISLEYTKRG